MISESLRTTLFNSDTDYLSMLTGRGYYCYSPMYEDLESDRCIRCKKLLDGTCENNYHLTDEEFDIILMMNKELCIKDLISENDDYDDDEYELTMLWYERNSEMIRKKYPDIAYDLENKWILDDKDDDDYLFDCVNYKNIDFENNPPHDYNGEIITKNRIIRAREIKSPDCVKYLKKEAGLYPFWTVTNYLQDNDKYPVYYLYDRSDDLNHLVNRYIHMINVVRGIEKPWRRKRRKRY